jgi:hypothetical protein
MSQEKKKGLQTTILMIGVFLITTVFAGGAMLVYEYRDASIDLSPGALISKDDLKTLKDPKGANKEAWDKLGREANERSQAQQPNWGQGWKK